MPNSTNIESLEKQKKADDEYNRLIELFEGVSTNRMVAVEPLVEQCARLKVRLDTLWEDICLNGEVEMLGNHERQRIASSLYNTLTGQYYKILYKITEMIPKDGDLKAKNKESKLDTFMDELSEEIQDEIEVMDPDNDDTEGEETDE